MYRYTAKLMEMNKYTICVPFLTSKKCFKISLYHLNIYNGFIRLDIAVMAVFFCNCSQAVTRLYLLVLLIGGWGGGGRGKRSSTTWT